MRLRAARAALVAPLSLLGGLGGMPCAAAASASEAAAAAERRRLASARVALRTGAVVIPHPDKVAKGGEDAYFATSAALGVFDGVGGWASVGVDPGLYSKELAATTARLIAERGSDKALEALTAAVENNSAIGSSTACVVGLVNPAPRAPGAAETVVGVVPAAEEYAFDDEEEEDALRRARQAGRGGREMHAAAGAPPPPPSRSSSMSSSASSCAAEDPPADDAPMADAAGAGEEAHVPEALARLLGVNLGDSGLVVIRDGVIVFATKEQQHYFNCPYQVGSGVGSDSVDTPAMGDVIDFNVQPGDTLILATDGCYDNLFPHEILATVAAHVPAPAKPAPAADPVAASPAEPASPSDPAPALSLSSVGSSDAGADDEPSYLNPQRVAQALADFALSVALDDRRQSPFAVSAQDAGHMYRGGKIDDITCVVAVVVPEALDAEAHQPTLATAAATLPKTLPTSPVTPAASPLSAAR